MLTTITSGGAGMYLGVLNYVAVYTTIRERPLYTAAIGILWGTGTILGPVVGGAFVSIYILMLSIVLELTYAGKQFCNMAVVCLL
jgi:MFS family permease